LGVCPAGMVEKIGNVAVLFPGQGAQYVGMGKELYETCPEARKVFEDANRLLRFDITGLMLDGPNEALTRTANSQPAIFVMSYAAWRALRTHAPWLKPRAFAGLSLGEYTALVAGGAFSFEEGLRVVRKRGEYMEEASISRPGTMASVVGLTMDEVRSACASARRFGTVNVANANSPGQVVISGERDAVEAAAKLAKERGAKTVIPLKVSGAFHSKLMEEAERRLSAELRKTNVSRASVPVVANVTGEEETEPEDIVENLAGQVTGTVLWQKCVEFLVSRGVKTFVEVGCGKVLQGLVKRICPQSVRMGVEDPSSLEATVRALEENRSRL
jgi:[acyl-carrier-protein] S-malonyltransferase